MHFFRSSLESKRNWTELDDLSETTLHSWMRLISDSDISAETEQLPVRIPHSETDTVVVHYRLFLDNVRQELALFAEELCVPYVFTVTDVNGMVLDQFGTRFSMQKMHDSAIGIGSSFAMEHAGINAVSAAMQLEETVFIRGGEHTIGALQEWSCICVPVHLRGKVYAYIKLSVLGDITPLLAAPFLEEYVWSLQDALNRRVS